MESKIKQRLTRKYLGEIPGTKNTLENRFNKAHLKAYLKGKKKFNHGQYSHITQQQISLVTI